MKTVTFLIVLVGTLVAILGTTSSMRRADWEACRTECTEAAGCADHCQLPHWLSLQSS